MGLFPIVQILVALSGSPAATRSPEHALDEAVALFESFDDEKAAVTLRALLAGRAPALVAAKAHIYLALIALNATDAEGAQEEFEKAIRTNVLVDLPPGQSPKVQILFSEVRREIAAGPMGGPASPQSATQPPITAVTTTSDESPSHLPAYVVGGIGVAALAAGGIFGFLQQQAGSSARNDASLTAALADGQPYAQDGIVADVLFGVGGAALVTAIVLYATEGSTKAPAVALSAGPRGFALSGAF